MEKSESTSFKISDFAFTVFSLWFFGELAYNILPIAVILIISVAYYEPLEKILLLREWNFASIVLCGTILNEFIQLKTKYQRDSSHRIYSGIRLFTIVLIIAVIFFILSILLEKDININYRFLGLMQIVIFIFTTFALLVPILYKVEFLNTYKITYKSVKEKRIINYFLYSFEEANDNIRHSVIALTRHNQAILDLFHKKDLGIDFEIDKKHIENLIVELQGALSEFNNKWIEATQIESIVSVNASE